MFSTIFRRTFSTTNITKKPFKRIPSQSARFIQVKTGESFSTKLITYTFAWGAVLTFSAIYGNCQAKNEFDVFGAVAEAVYCISAPIWLPIRFIEKKVQYKYHNQKTIEQNQRTKELFDVLDDMDKDPPKSSL